MPFSIRPEGAPKTNPSTKAEVEDGEIEDAKMTDVAMKGTEKAAKSKQEPSEKAEKAPQQAEPSAAGPETAKEPIPSEKPAPEPAAEPTSHAQPSPAPAASQPEVQPEEQGKQAEASRRPEHERAPSSSNTRPLPNRPFRQGDGRLPNRPDFVDDRRPRHPDHSRSFDSTTGDGRGYGPFERDLPARPLPDDPSRGPAYRDGRLPKEPDWPDRHGRMRAPPDAFHGRPEAPPGGPRSGPQTHPDRVELIHDRSERDRRGLPPLPPRGTTTL